MAYVNITDKDLVPLETSRLVVFLIYYVQVSILSLAEEAHYITLCGVYEMFWGFMAFSIKCYPPRNNFFSLWADSQLEAANLI